VTPRIGLCVWTVLALQAAACNQILGIRDGCMPCATAFAACQTDDCPEKGLVCAREQAAFESVVSCACKWCGADQCTGFCSRAEPTSPECRACIRQAVTAAPCSCAPG
jgi:hypothetical protein